ncbi:hypothetical protein EVG20_g7181 [Dentipellis fragilis]|uniref:Uncharacterized protein n=1 Tax=Dentipellis fragilis TaxID=205917 RepID=A0A4Y9YHD6_9AGAM|nr:hypothetical protein EVG20_g7181 [Dentipellis fragilis]
MSSTTQSNVLPSTPLAQQPTMQPTLPPESTEPMTDTTCLSGSVPIVFEMDETGHRIPDPKTRCRYTEETKEDVQRYKGSEAPETLDDRQMYDPDVPEHQPSLMWFGFPVRREYFVAYAKQHGIELLDETKVRRGLFFASAVNRVIHHMQELVSMPDLTVQHIRCKEATCIITLNSNYDWFEWSGKEPVRDQALKKLQEELGISGPLGWYYDVDPGLLDAVHLLQRSHAANISMPSVNHQFRSPFARRTPTNKRLSCFLFLLDPTPFLRARVRTYACQLDHDVQIGTVYLRSDKSPPERDIDSRDEHSARRPCVPGRLPAIERHGLRQIEERISTPGEKSNATDAGLSSVRR